MRWTRDPFGWRRHFALLPIFQRDQVIWLEWVERRFCGDCYEVRPLTKAAALKEPV